jgi:hypothetical protein
VCCLLAAAAVATGATANAHAGEGDRPAPTAKEKQEAGRHFRAGVQAFYQHKYEGAAEEFEKANEIVPNHKALFNAADAWEKAGALVKAAVLFQRYLDDAPADAKARDEAQARMAELTSKVGRLEIAGSTASNITLDGDPVERGQRFVTPGEHVVKADVEGIPIEKRVSVEAGSMLRVLLVPPPPPEPDPVEAHEEEAQDEGVKAGSKGVSPAVFYVSVGVTTALVGATVWSGLDTQSKRRDFDASLSPDVYDEGVAAQKRTNVLLGLSAAAGVATAAIGVFAVSWGDDEKATLSVTPRSASVRLRF